MKKLVSVGAICFVVGAFSGAGFWYLASPLWNDRVVHENLAQLEGSIVLSKGNFSDADKIHRGKGSVNIVKLPNGRVEVQLSAFEVTNGPDLELWLSSHPDPKTSSDVLEKNWVSLGMLKGNIGDQSYAVPPSVNLEQYNSIVVWCEQFGVLFSPAPLTEVM
ncbi:DM13 domain-containing protein [uncultured Cohaesibacter sp.]|uniref:DM13 domain-containing protein n=1 Tax=uncultured Cohaesibacter sp. TaxID=1002546 RepID=UPI0029C8302A|nr:DM13 domain-containing protein [uncultured Cohaesibacter sp.]